MTVLQWREEFSVGIEEVDHEHRELIELIRSLQQNLQAGAEADEVIDVLGEIYAQIAAHFALEETVMRKYQYDEYLAHKTEHEKLLDDLRDIMDNFEAGESLDYEAALGHAVRDWFVNHFKTKDARLHRLLGV